MHKLLVPRLFSKMGKAVIPKTEWAFKLQLGDKAIKSLISISRSHPYKSSLSACDKHETDREGRCPLLQNKAYRLYGGGCDANARLVSIIAANVWQAMINTKTLHRTVSQCFQYCNITYCAYTHTHTQSDILNITPVAVHLWNMTPAGQER